jgi:hypothetical protein
MPGVGLTDRVLDAAAGLGDSVTVAGLSIGGVIAAWSGPERDAGQFPARPNISPLHRSIAR